VCKRYLDKKTDTGDIDEEVMGVEDIMEEEEDPLTEEMVKVFACSHTYHMRCLRRTYRKKVASEGLLEELFSRAGQHRLRCPMCNIASFDFAGAEAVKPGARVVGVSKPGRGLRFEEGSPSIQDDDLRSYRD
jgi:hypothetical protein